MKVYQGSHYCQYYQIVLINKTGGDSPDVDGEVAKAFINDSGVVVLTANDTDIKISVFDEPEGTTGQNILNGKFEVVDRLLVGSVITGDIAELDWPKGPVSVSVYVNSDTFEEVTEVDFVLSQIS
jgi:hypothetical protein